MTTVTQAADPQDAMAQGADFGRGQGHAGSKVLIEFVSANPNSPLTLGHGRGGVLGDAIANLLAFDGADVTREFYVNDANASGQMRRFVQAVLARYRALVGAPRLSGSDGELGDYPAPFADRLARWVAETAGNRYAGLAPDLAVRLLTPAITFQVHGEQALTLGRLGIGFDHWFNESDLHARGAVRQSLARMKADDLAYNQAGALWLRSTRFGDESDHVLVRAGGQRTYLAGDLAYHADKFERGYTDLVDVWGSEHAGYTRRTHAGIAALGYDPDKLSIVLHGPVRLIKDGLEVKGGSLGGYADTLTLSELLDDLDADAARFFLLLAPANRPADLDADIARRQDARNPLWRIRQVLKTGSPGAVQTTSANRADELSALVARFPAIVGEAARDLAPDHIARFAVALADAAGPDAAAPAVRVALRNALRLLGIAPE